MEADGGGLATDLRDEAVGQGCGVAKAFDGLPAIGLLGGVADGWGPVGKTEAKVLGHGLGVRLVEAADGKEAFTDVEVATHGETGSAEKVCEARELLVGEASAGLGAEALLDGLAVEDVAEIDEDVAADGEGELGLASAWAFDGGDDERAGVEDGGESGEPALVVVLRAVVAKDGVGDVGFEHLRGPALPLREEGGEGFVAAGEVVAKEELAGGGWRASASVKHGDRDLACGEGVVEHGNVPDDESDEAKTSSGFRYEQEAGELGGRDDIAEAEREDGAAADVEAGAQALPERERMPGISERHVQAEVDERVGRAEQRSPDDEEHEQSERTVDAVELVSSAGRAAETSDRTPRAPAGDVKEAGEAEATDGATRQNDGLEGVDENAGQEETSEERCEDVHRTTLD